MGIVAFACFRIRDSLLEIAMTFLAPLSEQIFERLLIDVGQYIHYLFWLHSSLGFRLICDILTHCFWLMKFTLLHNFVGKHPWKPFPPVTHHCWYLIPHPISSAIPCADRAWVSFLMKYHGMLLPVSASLKSITPYSLPLYMVSITTITLQGEVVPLEGVYVSILRLMVRYGRPYFSANWSWVCINSEYSCRNSAVFLRLRPKTVFLRSNNGSFEHLSHANISGLYPFYNKILFGS